MMSAAESDVSEKVDEETFPGNPNSGTMDGNSDEDDEPILTYKKKKVNQSILEDSDDESGDQNLVDDVCMDKHPSEDEENGSNEQGKLSGSEDKNTNKDVGKPNQRKRIAVLDSSDSENEKSDSKELEIEEKDGDSTNIESNKPRIIKNANLLDELFDSEKSDGNADESDEDNTIHIQDGKTAALDEGYHGDDGESDEEEEAGTPQISEALRKKLAKGAAKKPKASRSPGDKPHRMKKEDIQQIHSESQRIMREREVRMPYHEPKKLGLSVFLARTQQKQEALKKITPGRWKQPDAAFLSKLNDDVKTLEKTECVEDNQEHTINKVEVGEDISHTKCVNQTETEIEQVKKQLNLDDLPDLIIEKSSECVGSSKEVTISSVKKPVNLPRLELLCDKDIQSIDGVTNILENTNDCATDVLNSDNKHEATGVNIKSDKLPEQDSGYLTTPLNSSEEESTSSHSEGCDSQEILVITSTDPIDPQAKVSVEMQDNSGTPVKEHGENPLDTIIKCNSESLRTENNQTLPDSAAESINVETGSEKDILKTPSSDTQGVKSKQKKTPVLASAALPAPRLSGNPDSFIDFDDEENQSGMKKPKSGINTLMERLIKHTAKRPKRKAKDVEISMVVKDQADAKEELKLNTFTYHIDGEEEEDPALQVPGAKLLKLKEKLKQKMTADREKARQLRTQLMDFDNDEDGFEEEGELTDQTDTDGEDEDAVNEEEDEEEMEDMEEYTEQEKQQKENNPFLDDEAESEGDEDEELEECGLHLQLDSQDSQGCEDSSSKSGPPKKDFLKSALSKTKSMDLFDEEANADSPTMSRQTSVESNIDISDRPFEQLSQGSQMVCEEPIPKTQRLELPSDCGNTNSLSLFKDRDTSFNTSMDTSFELMGSMIPAGQGTGKKNRPDADSPCSKSSAQSSRRYSVLSLPVENTQDLFTFSEASPTEYPKQTTQSTELTFHLDESQSRLLDEDGLLKMESTKKSSRRQLLLDEKESHEQDDDELLQLCSGTFTGNKDQSSKKNLFPAESQLDNSQSMNELMGLCSGQFTSRHPVSRSSSVTTDSSALLRSDSTEPFMGTQSDTMNELLGLCSGTFTATKEKNLKDMDNFTKDSQNNGPLKNTKSKQKKKKRKRIVVGSDDESDNNDVGSEDAEDSDEFEVKSTRASDQEDEEGADELESETEGTSDKFGGFKNDGKFLQQFLEAEAELSGSEAESDENYDLDEDEDVLEMEEGDNDVTLNQEELRNQVGRVHLKSVIDADKRQIRLMQEMYLTDGDLHSEGGGRQRKFKWRNIDDATQEDLFHNGSDEEVVEEEADQEKWRLQRYEREKFLQEIKENEENKTENEPIKLGNVCFKPKRAKSQQQLQSTENLVNESEVEATKSKPVLPVLAKPAPATTPGIFKVPTKRAGSFLSRSKSDLAKIAEKSKPVGSVSRPRNSRNFVFQTVSDEKPEPSEDTKKPQVKRANSTPKQSIAKKPKLEKSSSLPKDSIFNLY